MNKIIIFFLIILNISKPCLAEKFITWQTPTGRTGDQLLTYCKAKWASEHLHIPLLIQSYPGFEDLVFFDKKKKLDDFNVSIKKQNLALKHLDCKATPYCQDSDFEGDNILFVTDFNFFHKSWMKFDDEIKKSRIFPYNLEYTTNYIEKGINSHKVRFEHLLYALKEDQSFANSIKNLIHPKKTLKHIPIPTNAISIALHVRKGGGYDFPYKSEQEYPTTLALENYSDFFEKKDAFDTYNSWRRLRDNTITHKRIQLTSADRKESAQPSSKEELYSDVSRPLKHPPDQFYIDQLKMLVEMTHAPIYCYIFTDDPDPAGIADRYKQAINSPRVTFDFRKEKNSHSSNILEDMFAMSRFDCLIRPYSSLSQTAQLIGNHKLVISPAHGIWFKNCLIIDEVAVQKSDEFDSLLKPTTKKLKTLPHYNEKLETSLETPFIKSAKNADKVRIIVPAYNHPEFIVMQHATLTKFLKDEFEMIVFNDAPKQEMCDRISGTCDSLGISCIRVPQDIHDIPRPLNDPWPTGGPSARNCNVVQFALDQVGFGYDGIVVLFESDLFLIKDFSFYKYMKNLDLAGFDRSIEYPECIDKKIRFLWIGLIMLDMRTLPNKKTFNVNCGSINNAKVDSGGFTHFYLQANPQIKLHFFDKVYAEQFVCRDCEEKKAYRCYHNTNQLKQRGFNKKTIKFLQAVPVDWGSGSQGTRRNVEFFLDNHFVHFYGASEYAMRSPYCNMKQFYKDKAKAFEDFIDVLLRPNT